MSGAGGGTRRGPPASAHSVIALAVCPACGVDDRLCPGRHAPPPLGSRIKVKGLGGHRTEHTARKSTYSYQLETFRDSIRQRPESRRIAQQQSDSSSTQRNPRCGRAGATPLIRTQCTALAGQPLNECNNKPELRSKSWKSILKSWRHPACWK